MNKRKNSSHWCFKLNHTVKNQLDVYESQAKNIDALFKIKQTTCPKPLLFALSNKDQVLKISFIYFFKY